jgi:hypothetical protein
MLVPRYCLTRLTYLQSAVAAAIEKLAEVRELSDRIQVEDITFKDRLAAEYRSTSSEADEAYRRVLAEIDSLTAECGR